MLLKHERQLLCDIKIKAFSVNKQKFNIQSRWIVLNVISRSFMNNENTFWHQKNKKKIIITQTNFVAACISHWKYVWNMFYIEIFRNDVYYFLFTNTHCCWIHMSVVSLSTFSKLRIWNFILNIISQNLRWESYMYRI